MKGIYLGAAKAYHKGHDIVYQDIDGNRDIGGDMMNVDLSTYDYVIATPPCNFWSRARGNKLSNYSLETRHLLPDIIDKLIKLGKPFIVENVKNNKRFLENGLFHKDCLYFVYGRHTYWTNVVFPIHLAAQRQDFKYGGHVIKYDDMNDLYHQGGFNVHNVIELWINCLEKMGR